MFRKTTWALVAAAVLTAAGEVRAQYGYGWGGYGGYGWGGWGSTPGSSLARGLGYFYGGRGLYNVRTAEARSINTTTAIRWNNAVYQATAAMAQRHATRIRADMARTTEMRAEIQDRLRNHPTETDIADGDALNVLLDVLLNPATAGQSLQFIKTPLRSDLIRDIPFEAATEGMTVCLDRMTMDGQWPLALRDEAFRPEREGLRKAISAALEEDKEGNLDPETIRAVQAAIDKLRLKFNTLVPQDRPEYLPALEVINAMNGLTKMLYSPQMEKVLAELEDYQGTTLGDLLGFMQAFNLRFSPANSYRQRQIYSKLYPMLAEQANSSTLGSAVTDASTVATTAVKDVEKAGGEAVGTVERAGGDAIDGLKSAAVDLFKHLKW
jgi:hypothetical protein